MIAVTLSYNKRKLKKNMKTNKMGLTSLFLLIACTIHKESMFHVQNYKYDKEKS